MAILAIRRPASFLPTCMALFAAALTAPVASASSDMTHERMFERTFESRKTYADPFNDVNVDVIFSGGGRSWRVPAFWRGGLRWSVRFAPPAPGNYTYRLEATDPHNLDLNGHESTVTVAAYSGPSPALKHGMPRVSSNKRYFEYADGTPFYWLGDTWWMGFSSRLSWEDFKRLTADRKAKGFTVVLVTSGMVPFEEVSPIDPGSANEGGSVWDPEFKQINPRYFDFVDRRFEHLLNEGLTPVLTGAWTHALKQMGLERMQRHWRYLIARYGAYPVFWNAGGEVYDPPPEIAKVATGSAAAVLSPNWGQIVQYIRDTDPYRHPVSAHDPVLIPMLPDPALSDYHLFQCGHQSWISIATQLERLHQYYVDSKHTKPIVIGEIGYEQLGGTNADNFQRVAFWNTMLNGAAGHTYGANAVFESYSAELPSHRLKWSFMTWEEGMNLPGSYQVGINAKLLRQYRWWEFQPHPEWVTPRGHQFVTRSPSETPLAPAPKLTAADPAPSFMPILGEAPIQRGNFFLPYAAGIPGKLRFIYIPYLNWMYSFAPAPTVLGLEEGASYHAYFWDPIFGIKLDLGVVQRPEPGRVLFSDTYAAGKQTRKWHHHQGSGFPADGSLSIDTGMLSTISGLNEKNLVASVDAAGTAEVGLVVRFVDENNFLAAMYSSKDEEIYLFRRKGGVDGPKYGRTSAAGLGPRIRLSTEVRDSVAVVSVSDGKRIITSPIVDVYRTLLYPPLADPQTGGSAGLFRRDDGNSQTVDNLEIRQSSKIAADAQLERKLYDASGKFRGELRGEGVALYGGVNLPGWSDFGMNKLILLDAYRPEKLPFGQDWLLVLDATGGEAAGRNSTPRNP